MRGCDHDSEVKIGEVDGGLTGTDDSYSAFVVDVVDGAWEGRRYLHEVINALEDWLGLSIEESIDSED